MPKPSPTGEPRSTKTAGRTGTAPARRTGTTPAPARRAGTAAVAVVRAVVSVAVLALLLAGLPLVLWWGTTIVGPPALAALGHLFTTQDSGQVFLLALAALGWTGWALFTLSVLVEIPAQLRGRTAPQLRLLIGQRTAAALISTILMALPTGTTLAAAATPAHAATPAAATTTHPNNPEESGQLGELGQSGKLGEFGELGELGESGELGELGDAALRGDRLSEGKNVHGQRTVAYTVRDVRPAESLWSIAEARLGDGNRWEEIAELNAGTTMNDGTPFHPSMVIHPGWTLHLPADVTPGTELPVTRMRPMARVRPMASDAAPAHAASGPHTDGRHTQPPGAGEPAGNYTVRPGDTLSHIAQTQLGDPTRHPQIFHLNQGDQQPGGQRFTDPDLIYPGQHLDLPAPAAGHDDPVSPAHRDQEDTADPAHANAAPNPPGSAPADPLASTPGTGAGAAKPGAAPSHPSPPAAAEPAATPGSSATPPAPPAHAHPTVPGPPATTPDTATPAPAHHDDHEDAGRTTVLAAGIGTLLAASLAAALGVKRILQHRRRRAGQTIAIDPDPTHLEQVLNTHPPGGIALLDTVLRSLAAQAATDGHRLPAIRGARLTDRSVHLIPDDPAAPPLPPFTTTGAAPGTWVLDPALPLLPPDTARATPAPFPALITLGATGDGSLILINLLHSKTLLLDGKQDDVLAVARALALEAGTARWTDHTDIITIGLGSRLATLLPQGRIQTKPHLPSVTADLGALLVEAHQHADDNAPIAPLPWILIGTGDIEPEQACHLADAAATAAARDLPVAIVLPANNATRAAFPDAEHIPVNPATHVTLPHLTPDPIQMQCLTDDQYRQYIHALNVADQPAEQAHSPWQNAEDHAQTATIPHPSHLLVQSAAGSGDTDPGAFFPALLNSTLPPHNLTDASTNRQEKEKQDKNTKQEKPASQTPAPVPSAAGDTTTGRAQLPARERTKEPEEAGPTAPSIDILGPLHVTGISASGHGPKVAALAALIHLRPGRTAELLCNAMDPVSPWSTRTLQSRLSELRTRLGNTPTGDPYLPRPRNGTYQFTPGLNSDWTQFQNLANHALTTGPGPGTAGLEKALALVRGKPFDGQDYPWADAIHHEIRARITDTAHTLATWHTNPQTGTPDLDAARTAVLHGLDIDETAEVLYRDWMHIEWTAHNPAGIHKAITRAQQTARTYDITLEPLTEQTINHVLTNPATHTSQP